MRCSATIPLAAVLLCAAAIASAGVSWRSVGPGGGSDLLAVAIQPDDPNVIYVSGDIEGVFKTTDGGLTWRMMNRGLAGGDRPAGVYGVQELVIDPTNYRTIYACTWVGLFKSTDGAEHWTYISPAPLADMIPVSYLAVDPDDGNILYIGIGDADGNSDGRGEVYRSTDGGQTWQVLNTGMPSDAVVHAIVIDSTSPQSNRRIFVSTNYGVYRTTDGGETWTPVNNGLPHTDARRLVASTVGGTLTLFLGLAPHGDPANPSSYSGGLYKSTDGGDSWTSINGDLPTLPYEGAGEDGAPFFDYWKFDVHPTNPDILVAGTNAGGWDGGMYMTADGGASWAKVDSLENTVYGWMDRVWYNDDNILILKFAPSNPDIIVAGRDHVKKSTDGGKTWAQTYTTKIGDAWRGRGLEFMEAYDFGFDPADSNVMYVAYDDMGIWRSEDGGESFIRLDPVMSPEDVDCARSLEVDPANGTLYLGRNDGDDLDAEVGFTIGRFAVSSDHGDTWTFIDPATSGLPEGKPALALDPTSPADARVLYAAIYGHGVYKTSDGGQHWTAVNNGLGADAVYAWDIAIAKSDPQTLYLALNTAEGTGAGGIYKTTDGGQSWAKLPNLPGGDVLDVAIDPTDADVVYAGITDSYEGSTEGGLYKSTDGGQSWTKMFDQPRVGVVLVHPTHPQLIFAASQQWWNYMPTQNSGLYRSTDGGQTWEDITGELGHTWILGARVDPHRPNRMFVGTHGGGVWIAEGIIPPTAVADAPTPTRLVLEQNVPNPFNPVTLIRYHLPRAGHVRLVVYNLAGQKVATLADGVQPAGAHAVRWDASGLASGVYLYRIEVDGYSLVRRGVVIK